MSPSLLSNILRTVCVLFMIQVCTASPKSRDIDDKYETLLSNPPVEQNLIHGSFCTGDDCYATESKTFTPESDKDTATSTSSTPITHTAADGCKRLVQKIISSFGTPPLIEELRSLGKLISDNNGVTKKSAATLSSAEMVKPTESENGKENSLPVVDVSCLRKSVTSQDGESGNDVVRLPVIRRIFRFYIHSKPAAESVPNPVVRNHEETLVFHPIVRTEEPKLHSAVVNEPKIILRKAEQTDSNIHVLPLLTPVGMRSEHSDNYVRNADAVHGMYHLFHPLHSNINTQNLNYITPSVMEHYTPAHVHSYGLERPKLPEIVHLANSQPALPIPLYRVLVKEPVHTFGDSLVPGSHLHTIYPNEAKVPVSQWWNPLPSPIYSRQIFYAGPNYRQALPSGYIKKDTLS